MTCQLSGSVAPSPLSMFSRSCYAVVWWVKGGQGEGKQGGMFLSWRSSDPVCLDILSRVRQPAPLLLPLSNEGGTAG